MLGISSDDRLGMIERDHADRRAQAPAERMAKAAPAKPRPWPTAAEVVHVVVGRRPFCSATRLLPGVAGMRVGVHAHAGR
jgi:hypothetical protein